MSYTVESRFVTRVYHQAGSRRPWLITGRRSGVGRRLVMDRDDLFVGGSTVSGDRDLCPTSPIHLLYICVNAKFCPLVTVSYHARKSFPFFFSFHAFSARNET